MLGLFHRVHSARAGVLQHLGSIRKTGEMDWWERWPKPMDT
jgi:hypothetical protein